MLHINWCRSWRFGAFKQYTHVDVGCENLFFIIKLDIISYINERLNTCVKIFSRSFLPPACFTHTTFTILFTPFALILELSHPSKDIMRCVAFLGAFCCVYVQTERFAMKVIQLDCVLHRKFSRGSSILFAYILVCQCRIIVIT